MTNVMIVPADRSGCGYYRLTWPGQAVSLVRKDWSIAIVPPDNVQAGFQDGEFVGVRGFPNPLPDLLIMQRVGTPGQLAVLKWAHDQGIATVVDFDDAMWCIDRGNAAWPSWNLRNPYQQHWRICDQAVEYADLVTCTTAALAKRYGLRTEVIPNCVPKAAVSLPDKDNEVFTAGWAGFTLTHPGDCRISKPAVHAVIEAGGQIRVISDPWGAAEEWEIDASQVDPLPAQKLGPDWFNALSTLDLMLVGLRDTPFNQAKSFLKVLEAGASGGLSIAPANSPHRALAKTGFPVTLVDSPSEWYDAAKTLANLSRDDLTARSLEVWSAVRDGWTIEGNAERWAQAWERALARRS